MIFATTISQYGDHSTKERSVRKALITGIAGQDGSYLAELLLRKGYEVHGTVRRVALEDPRGELWRIQGILDQITLHAASLESYASMFKAVASVRPDECYHFAAQSFVSYSFDDEFSTITTNINGTHHILSAIRELVPECRIYFAGSSEMFGNANETPQTEQTAPNPRSPYGISKVAGYYLTKNYREAYGLFACSGICFNHESERRGLEYVTRKVTTGVARIKLGMAKEMKLGNIEAKRDWGYAPEYVEAMWSMLQAPSPVDYVFATGISHSVRELVEIAIDLASLPSKDIVTVDEELYRPAEIHELRGDSSKARDELGWRPKIKFAELVEKMLSADIERLERSG